ncbi:PIF1 protein [Hirsutella rhossiliensis]|uniref:PIF1 protein n=1 Tax=Hirsutella rhossiliensis TaxID=111463 RepID=A0A9P8MPR4_9HYPO|nr:PIF1 protein [Hirsutella rhossiliensis]KAH0959035.1 PIF1 protein [Hirsutella rhossiliensis]
MAAKETCPEVSVFWVYASIAERFRQSFNTIAQDCKIPGYDNPKTDVLLLVKRWLEKKDCGRWLLVIDNTDDMELFFNPRGNKTRTFLLKAANRVFTERPLSQVEVIAHLLGYPAEFSSGSAWAYVNANQLYWAVFRRWRHLRRASGAEATGDAPDETVVVEEAGPRIPLVEAYWHRGELLRGLCLYDYASLVRLKRNGSGSNSPRAAVQHLALFVPWESFLGEEAGDINDIWARARGSLAPRVARLADNVQLLRRSAEDAKRDAKQWAATAEEGGMTAPQAGDEGRGGAKGGGEAYRAGGAGDAARLIDVVRNAAGAGQVTAQSTELLAMTQQLCRFQQSALGSAAELAATVVAEERAGRRVNLPGSELSGAALPRQEEVRAIKSQELAGQLTLNEKQAIALLIVCRQLDRIRRGDEAGGDGGAQLCLFIGGEGGTGMSRVIEALVELLARRDLSSRLLVTATSGTAAARINSITLHSACGLTK